MGVQKEARPQTGYIISYESGQYGLFISPSEAVSLLETVRPYTNSPLLKLKLYLKIL